MRFLAAVIGLATGLAATPWVDDRDFPKAVQEKAFGATLRLFVPTTKGQGTAVRIHRHGEKGRTWYLTAAHSLKGLPVDAVVRLEWFTEKSLPKPARVIEPVTIAQRWENEDLALLAADGDPEGPVLSLVPRDKVPSPALRILAIGCSGGDPPSLLLDRVTAAPVANKPDGTKARYWKAETRPEEGRSGGPCVSREGYLIGICSGTHEGSGFYVHADEILADLEKSAFRRMLGLK